MNLRTATDMQLIVAFSELATQTTTVALRKRERINAELERRALAERQAAA